MWSLMSSDVGLTPVHQSDTVGTKPRMLLVWSLMSSDVGLTPVQQSDTVASKPRMLC